jgi:tRNA (guanine37-N1)-methyltransferase
MRLKEKLQGLVPEECLNRLSNRFHVIGDIAVLYLPREAEPHKKEIADAVLSSGRSIRVVLNKTTKLQGDGRVAAFELLAGSGSTVTTHREFGFSYRLDVSTVFWSSRLSYERMRVASFTSPGEEVIIPFSGVGPFAMPLAARAAHVLAVEKSREACLYLAENARINRVADRIAIVNGDAFSIAEMLHKDFHRAVIPAPYGAEGILEIMLPRVKSGGYLHFYTFKKRHQIEPLKSSYEDLGLEVKLCRRCGNVAPGVSRWVFDLVKT